MLISMHGKQALVTGAGTGIGRAIAYRLAEAGADFILVDIHRKNLEILKAELATFQTQIAIHQMDISQKEARLLLWQQIADDKLDILVNNAGIYPSKDFLDVDEALAAHIFDTNLNSVIWLCQEMIRRRLNIGGVIINIASIEAILPFKEDLAHHSVSKAGVIALTRALVKEHAKHGFRVNVVLPGGIVTPRTIKVAEDMFRLRLEVFKTGYDFKQRLPIGRFGQPDEVARIVLVLASELASYVQGAVIPVDGGFCLLEANPHQMLKRPP
ncbi:MAG: SDR family NAD(P)-dependent oxidoreductase [Candidatus Promineifilaceae bacterium]